MTSWRRLFGLATLYGTILLGTTVHGLGQNRQTIAPEGYVDLDGLWDSPATIQVCWETSARPYTQEVGWVQDAVQKHIADPSSISFRWNECSAQAGIRVSIADETPRSNVGRQWLRDANGVRQQDTAGRWIQKPTLMTLNFSFDSTFTGCKPDREHCIRAIGVHEFLHAIGFLHEQLRNDAAEECKAQYAHTSDFRGFRPQYATQDYDAESHMNYCANMYRKPIRLSEGDLYVLRKFYPKP